MIEPYQGEERSRFWSTGVRYPLQKNKRLELISLLDLIEKDSVVCAAGSCFAQHIGKNLIKRKFNFLISKFNKNRTESFGFGNIYTTKQMLQWLEFSIGKREWSNTTFFKDKKNQIFDYLTPHLPSVKTVKHLSERRNNLKKEIVSNLKKTDIFIFTCGLTEQWETTNGEALAIAPGTAFGIFDSNKHRFLNLKVNEIKQQLNNIEKIILTLNPKIKFIYTVSPVPLTATAEKEHVLVATSFSKAKLRAAIGEHVRLSKSSFYFPAFELITHNTLSDWRFEKNLRNVSDIGIDFVMQHGFKTKTQLQKNDNETFYNPSNNELHCEEQKLETLNRTKLNTRNQSNFFLIGDSHIGKLGEALNSFGKIFYGGQIMNSTGFSDLKFLPHKKKIFVPTENIYSKEIWENTFCKLEKYKGKANIYTNIGFQANINIPNAVDSIGIPFLTLDDVENFFLNHHKKTLDLLKELSKFGNITFVEDPNTYSLFSSYPINENILRLMKLNFSTYTSYLKKLSIELNGSYLSKFHLILQKIHKETGNGLNSISKNDIIHGSKIYYKKLAEYIISNEI